MSNRHMTYIGVRRRSPE